MDSIDHNALLLQVMAHDLLAPLTAVKWQTELLGKEGVNSPKFFERLQGMYDSTNLGISLTKHAHVAGRVLVGSYEQDKIKTPLTDIVRAAALDLKLQYERHGLTLEVEVDTDPSEREVDVNLVSLFVWSIAKFYLACAPANTLVHFQGISAPNEAGSTSFVFIGSASNIPETEECVRTFSAGSPRGSYDQAFIFGRLIHTVAPLIGVTVNASAQNDQLIIEASFDHA